jgi:hypothetical protein
MFKKCGELLDYDNRLPTIAKTIKDASMKHGVSQK